MMDVLFLCGYFESKYQKEIVGKSKQGMQNAANTFQKRLISGFNKQDINFTVISAPFIGAWPMAYSDYKFTGFEAGSSEEHIEYVSFNNVWGYRNISRATALKKRVKEFLTKSSGSPKAIVIYSAHTPLLEAAVYAKRIDPVVHIHMIVPDLHQYMNLSKSAHPVYDFFKKLDIKKFNNLNRHVDSYMLLTQHMADKLDVGRRPYIVVEAVVDDVPEVLGNGHPRGKRIAYAGLLAESYGVKRLMEAFALIDDPEATLELCGDGELRAYIEKQAQEDKRIHYHGQVAAEKANEILMNADVLVNPRINDSEYTRYSFPSKNIEYLMTGNRVVAYQLDGMPEVYRDFLLIPFDDSEEMLAKALQEAILDSGEENEREHSRLIDYCNSQCVAHRVTYKIVRLIQSGSVY